MEMCKECGKNPVQVKSRGLCKTCAYRQQRKKYRREKYGENPDKIGRKNKKTFEMCDEYANTEISQKELAEKYGISPARVCKVLQREGVKKPHKEIDAREGIACYIVIAVEDDGEHRAFVRSVLQGENIVTKFGRLNVHGNIKSVCVFKKRCRADEKAKEWNEFVDNDCD